MNKMEDFKQIADDIMKDLNITEELKHKTLSKCTKDRKPYIGRTAVSIACLLLVFAAINAIGLFLPGDTGGDTLPDPNIVIGEPRLLPGDTAQSPNDESSFDLVTLEDAKKVFKGSLLIPEYMPEGFEVLRIQAKAYTNDSAVEITLIYSDGLQYISINQTISDVPRSFNDYTIYDINGAKGYLKSTRRSAGETHITSTELHWNKNGVQYTITGLIDENEAVKIAKSLK